MTAVPDDRKPHIAVANAQIEQDAMLTKFMATDHLR